MKQGVHTVFEPLSTLLNLLGLQEESCRYCTYICTRFYYEQSRMQSLTTTLSRPVTLLKSICSRQVAYLGGRDGLYGWMGKHAYCMCVCRAASSSPDLVVVVVVDVSITYPHHQGKLGGITLMPSLPPSLRYPPWVYLRMAHICYVRTAWLLGQHNKLTLISQPDEVLPETVRRPPRQSSSPRGLLFNLDTARHEHLLH